MRTGKSTLAKLMQSSLEQDGKFLQIMSFAQELRVEVAHAMFPNVPKAFAESLLEQAESIDKSAVRPLLQAFGQAKRDLVDKDYWVNALAMKRNLKFHGVIVDDVRHKNEADWILDNGGILIRLRAHEDVLIERGADSERLRHYSETAMQTPSQLETEYPHRVLTLDTGGMSPLGMFKRLMPFVKEMIQ